MPSISMSKAKGFTNNEGEQALMESMLEHEKDNARVNIIEQQVIKNQLTVFLNHRKSNLPG